MTPAPPHESVTRPELVGNFGMVASTHWLASSSAMSVLELGGNAFDAAAAAGFVLQVVEPHLSGPAGEVPIVLWSNQDQEAFVVCGQGVAPSAATPRLFRDLGLDAIPGTGLLPATVPGAFGGWLQMLQRWGSLPLREVLRFAISFARDGIPVAPLLARTLDHVADLFIEDWPTSAEVWLSGGRAPRTGERLRNPELAATYERVLTESEASGPGRDTQYETALRVWYEGFVADEIVDFCTGQSWPDSTGRHNSGLLSGDDLARWRASIESPATHEFGPYTLCKTGPWGQGPVLLQQLALLDHANVWDAEYGSGEYFHLLIECSKLAYADREAWYGDGNPIDGLVPALLDPGYVKARGQLVMPSADFELRPGSVLGQTPQLSFPDSQSSGDEVREPGGGEPTLGPRGIARGDTCHVDVVDRFGNMVSATPSGGWLQSSPAIPALGFCLGTRGQMFSLADGHPNELRPQARPRTTLTPSLALHEERPWLAFGTPGGDQQDQWNLQFFLSIVLGGRNLQEAIDSPAFTSQHFPGSFHPHAARPGHLIIEDRVGEAVISDLEARGHEVSLAGPWTLGRLSAVQLSTDGFLRAGANPRGNLGYAVGR